MKTISNKLRFFSWLALLSLPLAIYYASFYAPDVSQSTVFVSSIFYVAAIGHFFIYFLVGNIFLLLLPLIFAKNRNIFIWIASSIVVSCLMIVLGVDAHVFSLYRFHVNMAMLDLLINGRGQIISFSWSTIASISIEVIILVVYAVAIVRLAMRLTASSHLVWPWVSLAFCLLIAANITHAMSTAKANLPIMEIANRLPLYKPLTMNRTLVKLGYVTQNELANRKVNVSSNGLFNYPKNKLNFKPVEKRFNVVWIYLDAVRADMLNASVMPNLAEYAKDAFVFKNHYSSSNCTRGGIFGAFYGIPPSYWHMALSSGVPAAIVQAVRTNNYEMGLFTSATLAKPEFNETIFVGEKNLRLYSRGNSVIERDENSVQDFISFIEKMKEEDRNFFSFVFLDNVHAYAVPDSYKRPFQPSWKTVNYMAMKPDLDPTECLNLYKNACHWADVNVSRILGAIQRLKLDENTIVVISSDHGEEFNDNKLNYWGHNSNFTDAQVKIPLVVKWPGRGAGIVNEQSTAYDLTATILPEVFGVTNSIRDYSIGQNLFSLKPIDYTVGGSYSENAIIEGGRIVLVDRFGMLRFKDKNFNDIKDPARNKNLYDAVKTLYYEYLDSKDK